MICAECGSEMRRTDEPLIEKYRGVEISIDGIERHVCDSCGNDVMSAEMATKLGRALVAGYAKSMGLLSPMEIREIRKSLGMNQRDFEELIGVSSPTVSRWETGVMTQPRSTDKLLKAIRDVPEVGKYLMATMKTEYQTAVFSQKIIEFKPHDSRNERRESLRYEFEEAKEV